MTAALSVLDFVPVIEGGSGADAISATIDLAQNTESWGYRRYWLGEHHLTEGSAGSAPFVLASTIAERTRTIRVGTAAVVTTMNDPVRVAESAGTVAAIHPGRFDLGIARGHVAGPASTPAQVGIDRTVDGIAFPVPRKATAAQRLPRYAHELHDRIQREPADLESEVTDVLAYLSPPTSTSVQVLPAAGADLEVWIHGTNPGRTPRLSGALGLPFGANYHFAGAGLLDSIAEYRAHFVPGHRAEPYVAVSVDAVVADTESLAAELADANRIRALHNRRGAGVAQLPSPRTVAAHSWTPELLELTADRAAISLTGTAPHVADTLKRLEKLTGADEFVVNTTAFSHQHRLDSYRLLAQAWALF